MKLNKKQKEDWIELLETLRGKMKGKRWEVTFDVGD
jgi:hypothetical protein